jgi:hypothetical protein
MARRQAALANTSCTPARGAVWPVRKGPAVAAPSRRWPGSCADGRSWTCRQVGQDPRHPDEAHFPLIPQGHHRLDSLLRFHLGAAGRHVHLHQVQPVRPEPAQALLDSGPDVGTAIVVRERRPGTCWRVTEHASALGRQEELIPAMAHITADELLAAAIVNRGVEPGHFWYKIKVVQEALRGPVRNF